MATDHDDPSALRDIIVQAMELADERANHLIGALLAHCLEQLDEREF